MLVLKLSGKLIYVKILQSNAKFFFQTTRYHTTETGRY